MSLKRKTLKQMKNTPVILNKDIRTIGGEVFRAGETMYIVDKWRGWGLSRHKNSIYDIRCVSENSFIVPPPTAAEGECEFSRHP